MRQYREYGYTSLAPNFAHQYILPGLVKMLHPSENKCILDIGCGNGSLALALHKMGYKIYGIDASKQGIALANTALPGHFFIQDIQAKKLPPELQDIDFDTIISTEVIEHLYAPRDFLDFCKTCFGTNPGPKQLLLSTPYHGYLKNLALALAGALDQHFTVLWDGGHIKFWSRKTLTKLLLEKGFEVTDFRGVGRLPYLWKSMLLKSQFITANQ